MQAHGFLIAELEQAIASGSKDRRIETLRRVTDLFLSQRSQLNDGHVAVFDDVLGHLIQRIESQALVELSECLAPLDNAPIGIVRRLAQDDEIAVAGPILMQSPRLSTSDLVEIAKTKGQEHLLAISGRTVLEAPLTDVLLERGSPNVARKLADSDGARFSEDGYLRLVQHAGNDDGLAEALGSCVDLPKDLLRKLVLQASDAVRQRLLARAAPEQRQQVRAVIAGISKSVEKETGGSRDYQDAQRYVVAMRADGKLTDAMLLEFAQSGRDAETIAALALLASAPIDLVARIYDEGRVEALMIPCKAAGISWMTLRTMLRLRSSRFHGSEREINQARSEYLILTKPTAQRVLRFWNAQQSITEWQMDTLPPDQA